MAGEVAIDINGVRLPWAISLTAFSLPDPPGGGRPPLVLEAPSPPVRLPMLLDAPDGRSPRESYVEAGHCVVFATVEELVGFCRARAEQCAGLLLDGPCGRGMAAAYPAGGHREVAIVPPDPAGAAALRGRMAGSDAGSAAAARRPGDDPPDR